MIDPFRRFVFETRFFRIYLVDPKAVEQIKTNDELLLQPGMDWLKNVTFNEPSIPLRKEVPQGTVASMRAQVGGS